MSTAGTCALCGSAALDELDGFEALPRITSDCKPFPAGGRLRECRACGAAQKAPTARWREEIARIYAQYMPYHQAEGVEQIVLDSNTGTLRRRSEVILSRLRRYCDFPAAAHALDVGCGSGATLRVMAREFPDWRLYGLELDSRNHAHLHSLPGVQAIFDCPAERIGETFDLITSIHALEHFDRPLDILRALRARANPGAWLFIQTPNLLENPFDVVVADHFMHYSPQSLAMGVRLAGFEVVGMHTDWVSKENSLLARATPAGSVDAAAVPRGVAAANVTWLAGALAQARASAREARSFGIFGTSIAATWFASALGGAVDFFVDEDPLRQQQRFMDRPVLPPERVPAQARVLLALAPATAFNVQRRLRHLRFVTLDPGPIAAAGGVRCMG